MVKKQQTTRRPKDSKSKENLSSAIDVFNGFSRRELTMFSVGLGLLLFAVFMLVAFTSYLFSGDSDYSILENPTLDDVSNEGLEFKNVCGSLGAMISYFFINNCFGLASYIIPVFLVLLGMKLMRAYKVRIFRWFILLAMLLVWLSVAFSAIFGYIPLFDGSFINPGGNHGKYVVKRLVSLVGTPGLFGILVLFAIFYLTYLSHKTVEYVRKALHPQVGMPLNRNRSEKEPVDADEPDTVSDVAHVSEAPVVPEHSDEEAPAKVFEDPQTSMLEFDAQGNMIASTLTAEELGENIAVESESAPVEEEPEQIEPSADPKPEKASSKADTAIKVDISEAADTERGSGEIVRGSIDEPYDPKLDLEYYHYPTLDLLDKGEDSRPSIDMAEQNANKERIITILRNFGVEISSIKATIGPTITLYEITPAEGVRISKIRNLEDDIALSLAAEGIRIIAPIPGKGTIGIEVPNKKKCIVSMESIIGSRTYQESTMELPCALGKTITNEVFMIDLAKAPHLLVAGATGMGKSVGLNAIVTSLLYKKHPSELKIVMVDPKKVEFSIYSPIENHFLAKLEGEDDAIITDVSKVVQTLKSLCQLMDTRYDLLKKARVRNIKEYNAKFRRRELNPENGHEFMPYIVVIIDEFGDLIMTAGKEIELPICRIAQLARAVGIHMIIATQRPTTSIITGTIKANFPARIAFRVAAMMDSRIILDRPGANQLIGRGDMLYLQGSDPVRVQCAFVDTPEVSRICQFICQQQSYPHALYLPEVKGDDSGLGGSESSADMKHLDPMFDEVAHLIVSTQQGSTSLIQRKFSIGYNRAGRLMDQMEKAGIVGPQQGSKPREVLIADLVSLENLLNSLR